MEIDKYQIIPACVPTGKTWKSQLHFSSSSRCFRSLPLQLFNYFQREEEDVGLEVKEEQPSTLTTFLSHTILGHCHLLSRPLNCSLTALSKRYGPIPYLRLGSRPVFLVSSSSAAEVCLSKNDIVFANRSQTVVGKYIGYNDTAIIFANYGPRWRNLRRISTVELLPEPNPDVLRDPKVSSTCSRNVGHMKGVLQRSS